MQNPLLIFDLDGTLVDSLPDLAAAVNAALNDLNLPPCDIGAVAQFVGNGSYVLCERVLAHLGQDKNAADALHERFLARYGECSGRYSRLYDGVAQGLTQLAQAGFTLALATNKPERFVGDILRRFGIDRFAVVVGGDTLPQKKPDPLPLLRICQTLSVDPSRSFMIGDSKNDVQAGKNAGIATLALSYGYNHGEPIAHARPDRVFDSFGDLCAFLLASKGE